MRVIGIMINSMAGVNIFGLMAVSLTVYGKMVKKMVMAHYLPLMAASM